MGDVGETFNAMREAGKEKRERNRESSPKILRQHDIEFEEKNMGAHLIVKHNGYVIDFWPGTGKWIDRATSKHRRGVYGLMRHIGAEKKDG